MKIYILLLLLVLLGACSPSTKKRILSEILPSVEANNTIFKLSPQQDTVVHSEAGLVLFIAKNSFVDKNGESIKEPIELELKSYKKLSQMLGEGLRTYADEELLISDGMFELTAKTSSGKEVFINKASPLKLVAGVDKAMPELQLFKGQTKDDNINWTSPRQQSNSPVIIPFEILDPIDESIGSEFRSYLGYFISNECNNNSDSCLLNLLHYQNTFIATSNFWDRYWYSLTTDHILQRPNNLDAINRGEILLPNNLLKWSNADSLNLLDLYTSMEVWKVDSMILKELIKNKGILNDYYQEAIDKWTAFKNQKITQVDPRFFIDIDTAALKQFEQTFRDGFELDKLRYQSYQYLSTLSERVTFDVGSFGWYNLDRFLNDPSAKPTELAVSLQATNLLVLNLVLKNNRTILTPSSKNGNTFTFTGKLPQVPAYLIAISEEDGQLLLAKKEILIGQNKEEQLELEPVTVEELEQALEAIEEGYTAN